MAESLSVSGIPLELEAIPLSYSPFRDSVLAGTGTDSLLHGSTGDAVLSYLSSLQTTQGPNAALSIARGNGKHTLVDALAVHRPDGPVWLNVGDAFTTGRRRSRAPDRKNRARAMAVRPPTPRGLKPKDLIGVPWRLALALQAAGWWLRSELIGHKPNAYPESVRDRPTKAHETLFLLSKQQDYFYDIDAVRGPRRLRSVWEIATEPLTRRPAADHPAKMPLTLARRCLALTSRADSLVLDPYAGSGTTLLAAQGSGRCWIGIEINP